MDTENSEMTIDHQARKLFFEESLMHLSDKGFISKKFHNKHF